VKGKFSSSYLTLSRGSEFLQELMEAAASMSPREEFEQLSSLIDEKNFEEKDKAGGLHRTATSIVR
jgi:hypothetical protein